MTTTEMLLRMGLAVIVSGLIGFDREVKNRPAGIRTHLLVDSRAYFSNGFRLCKRIS
jgi:uncharacterized membrane protein YhiD involved in acid resistance